MLPLQIIFQIPQPVSEMLFFIFQKKVIREKKIKAGLLGIRG
jgi:hypothetical protein